MVGRADVVEGAQGTAEGRYMGVGGVRGCMSREHILGARVGGASQYGTL